MRIAVNTRLLLKDKLEGIGWFANETLSRIVKNHPEHQFIFFFDRPYHPDFVFGSNVTPVVLAPQARHPFLYYIWSEKIIPHALKKHRADVYFSPEGLGCIHTKIPVCITLHDLAYKHYPQFMDRLHRWHYRRFYPKYARSAKRIVTVSEFTKQDIIHEFGITPEKIDIVYNAGREGFGPLPYREKEAIKAQLTGGNEYFLFVGAIHPRKNIINLLKAFVKFKRRQRSNMKLVIVGRMAWQFEEVSQAKNSMPYKEDVIWMGYLGIEELTRVNAAAYALVYPSVFEGFGIPIVEAMESHVPVIVSNTSSMPEVGGPAALLVDPESPEDIAEKMGQIYKDETLRSQLIAKAMIQKEKFNWDVSAAQLWESILKTGSS